MSFKSLSIVAAATMALFAGAAQASSNGFANGTFTTAYAGTPTGQQGPAADWLFGGSAPYTVAANAGFGGAGDNAALLNCGQLCSSVLVQNSVKDGGLPALVVGDTPLLTFEMKGQLGTTGSDNFQLQYLDGTGNILYNSGVQTINPGASYSLVSFQGGAVPAGAVAAYLQVSQAIGPVGQVGVPPSTFTPGSLYVSDVNLAVAGVSPVPEPESYAMMFAGVGVVGSIIRRRRRVA